MTIPPAKIAVRGESPLTVLAFTALAGTMAIASFTAVVGPVVRRLGLVEWHSGLAMTAAGVLWTLLARRWGALSDRVGRRRVLLLALAASTAIYFGLALFVDFAIRNPPAILLSVVSLVVLRSAIGAFHSALPPTAAAMVADHTPAGTRAAAMAKLGTANSVGMIAGPAVAGWLATYHLSWPLYGAAFLPLSAWVVLWWRLPLLMPSTATTVRPPLPPSIPPSIPPSKRGMLDRRLMFPALAILVTSLSVSVAQISVGFFAIDRLHLTPEQGATVAGWALTCVGIGLISAQSILMRMRKISPAAWIGLGTLISSIGFVSVSFVASPDQLLLAYGLAAFGMGFTFPSIQAIAADAVEAHEQGSAAGTIASMQGMGMTIGPLLGTLVYRFSPSAPYLMVGALLLSMSASVSFMRKLK